MLLMTLDQFKEKIEVQMEIGFDVNSIHYTITYDRDSDGKPVIVLSEAFLPGTKYHSLTEMLADAEIQNHYLRDLIDSM